MPRLLKDCIFREKEQPHPQTPPRPKPPLRRLHGKDPPVFRGAQWLLSRCKSLKTTSVCIWYAGMHAHTLQVFPGLNVFLFTTVDGMKREMTLSFPESKTNSRLNQSKPCFPPSMTRGRGGGVILIFHCNSSWGVFQHTIKTKLQYERNRLQIFIFFLSPCHTRVGLNESEGRKSWKR